jgi:transcription elongation GreA/GreB family factor
MSKAFTRESDAADVLDLPDREISPYPNLVTPEGLAAIEAQLAHWARRQAEALEAGDRGAAQRAARELRYWTARSLTAQPAPEPPDDGVVHFGSTVTLERSDGRRAVWRIVGEDEADPAGGLLSHAAPLARALIGKVVGEEVSAGAFTGEIVAIKV